MVRLTDRDIEKLASTLGISEMAIHKLYATKLLDEKRVVAYLMRSDYRILRKDKRFLPSQLYFALGHKYNCTHDEVKRALTTRDDAKYYCSNCNKQIKKCVHKRNNGLCDECVALSIDFNKFY